jgi:ABC-type dipeptide/oligopeptide/nickel transport system permease component
VRAFVNGGRSALLRSVANAIAIFVIVFGLAAALGGLGSAAHVPAFEGRIAGEIGALLPITLEPVLISFFVASALGFVLTFPSAPAFRVAVAVIVTGLESLPIFVLAIAMVIVPMLARIPTGLWTCRVPCTDSYQLDFLVVPVVVLTTYQLPILVKFFDSRRSLVQSGGDDISTAGGLAILFADRLPSLVSAAMVGEVIYRWAGEGRWLGIPNFLGRPDASVFTLFLILNALVVLLIRSIVEFFVRRRRSVAGVGG